MHGSALEASCPLYIVCIGCTTLPSSVPSSPPLPSGPLPPWLAPRSPAPTYCATSQLPLPHPSGPSPPPRPWQRPRRSAARSGCAWRWCCCSRRTPTRALGGSPCQRGSTARQPRCWSSARGTRVGSGARRLMGRGRLLVWLVGGGRKVGGTDGARQIVGGAGSTPALHREPAFQVLQARARPQSGWLARCLPTAARHRPCAHRCICTPARGLPTPSHTPRHSAPATLPHGPTCPQTRSTRRRCTPASPPCWPGATRSCSRRCRDARRVGMPRGGVGCVGGWVGGGPRPAAALAHDPGQPDCSVPWQPRTVRHRA